MAHLDRSVQMNMMENSNGSFEQWRRLPEADDRRRWRRRDRLARRIRRIVGRGADLSGAWCPFCNAQLAGYAAEKGALDGLGVKVVALSVDDESTSAATAAKNHLQFPVGHSVDAGAVAAATGAFVNRNPHYLQPASFVLAPDGAMKAGVYATSAIGRMVAKDVVGLVGYLQSIAAKAAAAE